MHHEEIVFVFTDICIFDIIHVYEERWEVKTEDIEGEENREHQRSGEWSLL